MSKQLFSKMKGMRVNYVFCFKEQESGFKVEGSLSQQEESHAAVLKMKDQSIQLVKTWSLDHVKSNSRNVPVENRFTVSKSGAVGISCEESPSLSVMYPDMNKSPVILSNEILYRSATFVNISGKEYLAAACGKDGCLHFWNIQSKTFQKGFDTNLPKDKLSKDMVICRIDEGTVGYGEEDSSLDGSRRVFILKMDTEEFTLSSTVKIFTPGDICDMCYTEVNSGIPCLLLCVRFACCIKEVEMDGGRTRWKVGKEQMGEKFLPLSICTDDDGTLYVADFGLSIIHLLYATDGTVIKQFNIGRYHGIVNIFAVRFHDQHLYVERKRKILGGSMRKYATMKFKQTEKM